MDKLNNDEVNVTVEGVPPDELLSRLEGVARTTDGCLNAGAGEYPFALLNPVIEWFDVTT